jgi:hypothetical protein
MLDPLPPRGAFARLAIVLGVAAFLFAPRLAAAAPEGCGCDADAR